MTLLIAIIVYPFIYRWLRRIVDRADFTCSQPDARTPCADFRGTEVPPSL